MEFKGRVFKSILDKDVEKYPIFFAIRKSLVMMIPIILIGSFGTLLQSLPIEAYQSFIKGFSDGIIYDIIYMIRACCWDYFSLLLIISISMCYSSEYTDNIDEIIISAVIGVVNFLILSNVGSSNFDMASFNVAGTFTAVFIGMTIGPIYMKLRMSFDNKLTTDGLFGTSFSRAVNTLIPAIIVFGICLSISFLLSIIFNVSSFTELISKVCLMIFNNLGTGFLSGFIYTMLIHVLWLFGIHGSNALTDVSNTLFVEAPADQIFNKTLFDAFIIIGGCGATLALVIAIVLVSRNRSIRNVAKQGFIPVLFNINELITFGLPIIFNPIMAIPFVLVPLVSMTTTYLAVYFEIIPRAINEVGWTTPVILSGYKATGSIAGSLLQIVNICLAILIYIPFLRLYEEKLNQRLKVRVKTLVEFLMNAENEVRDVELCKRRDVYGSTAQVISNDLKKAITNKELYMEFQPQVDNDGCCIGAEALLRWSHPIVGFIYPPLIIQLAKENNVLAELENLIFDNSCRVTAQAREVLGFEIKVSINITAKSLARKHIIEEIQASLDKYSLDADNIYFELTESEILSTNNNILEKLAKLKKLGFHLLIDDFSMGHTSVKYLQTDCFSGVKLDAAITKNVTDDHVGREIISSLAALGKKLDIGIIAEYVEDTEQRDILSNLGCTLFQGWLYSKALPEDKFLEYIQNNKKI